MEMENALRESITNALCLNDVVGEQKSGSRRFWTTRELKVLDDNYPIVGAVGCLELLPGRSVSSIYNHAIQRKLIAPTQHSQRRGVPRRLHPVTPQKDAIILQRYPECRSRGDVTRLALQLGETKWYVNRRAMELGLVQPRFKEPYWTEPEIEILRKSAHFGNAIIQRHLKKAGYARSQLSIKIKLRRLLVDRESRKVNGESYFTATGLAAAMGVNSTTVASWIEKGLLAARKPAAGEAIGHATNSWWITRSAVRSFIVDHPFHVNLSRVDKFWFIDLLGGRYAEV